MPLFLCLRINTEYREKAWRGQRKDTPFPGDTSREKGKSAQGRGIWAVGPEP